MVLPGKPETRVTAASATVSLKIAPEHLCVKTTLLAGAENSIELLIKRKNTPENEFVRCETDDNNYSGEKRNRSFLKR